MKKRRGRAAEENLKNEKGKRDLERIARECACELKKAGIPIGRVIETDIVRDGYVFGRLYKLFIRKGMFHKMNAIRTEDLDVMEPVYDLLGECGDKLKIAGVPVGDVSGAGFVQEGHQTGIHDNWDESFSIGLPEAYRRREKAENGELRSYLFRELF